ncbi:MAG: outer membrane protein assembly factor BamE [Alphaproteobacteria bacterium]|nr:outer membrane protein assembly factor BamE [Alphaproteobacteria bacterium]
MKLKHCVILPALLVFCACSPRVDTRGHVSTASWKESVITGSTTRDDILANFGSPSATSSFGDETWYYISARRETVAFFAPETVEQQVVRVVFEPSGVVKQVEYFDQSASREFDLAKRTTPTEGHTMNALEQMLGNIGRFNRGGDTGAAPGRRGGNPGGF